MLSHTHQTRRRQKLYRLHSPERDDDDVSPRSPPSVPSLGPLFINAMHPPTTPAVQIRCHASRSRGVQAPKGSCAAPRRAVPRRDRPYPAPLHWELSDRAARRPHRRALTVALHYLLARGLLATEDNTWRCCWFWFPANRSQDCPLATTCRSAILETKTRCLVVAACLLWNVPLECAGRFEVCS